MGVRISLRLSKGTYDFSIPYLCFSFRKLAVLARYVPCQNGDITSSYLVLMNRYKKMCKKKGVRMSLRLS